MFIDIKKHRKSLPMGGNAHYVSELTGLTPYWLQCSTCRYNYSTSGYCIKHKKKINNAHTCDLHKPKIDDLELYKLMLELYESKEQYESNR